MDPGEALRRLFGFEHFRPGQAEAVARRARRPRRARGDAHRLGQVAVLPAAGADARRPDARGLAARLADAGPGGGAERGRARRVELVNAQRGGGANRRRWRGAAAERCGCCTSRPSGSPRLRSPSSSGGSSRAVRRRRGALHLAVGPRLPPRLLLAGRRRAAGLGAQATIALTATATPARRRRHRAPAGAARSGSRDDRLRPPEPLLCGRSVRDAADKRAPAGGGAARSPMRCRRSCTPGTRGASEELAGSLRARWARRCSPITQGWGEASARPRRSGSCRARCG